MKGNIDLTTKYQARISYSSYSGANDILVSYYLPLIGAKAYSIYSLLSTDARNLSINTFFIEIDRIISILNISLEELEEGISKLEVVHLLKVYKDEEERLTFALQKPLSPQEFNGTYQLRELFSSKAGKNNLEVNNKFFNEMKETTDETQKLITEEVNIGSINDGNKISKLNVHFSFDKIKTILNSRNINYTEFWTQALEAKLLDLIVVYDISSLDIAIEIISLYENGTLNELELINKVKSISTTKKDIEEVYNTNEKSNKAKLDLLSSVSTREYFSSRFEREPSDVEMEMISKLNTKYGLDSAKINLLIDFSYIVNNGSINKNYIFKIADTILKEGMNDIEQIKQHLTTAYKVKKDNNPSVGKQSKTIEFEDKIEW